jgi:hypothetical protein
MQSHANQARKQQVSHGAVPVALIIQAIPKVAVALDLRPEHDSRVTSIHSFSSTGDQSVELTSA